MLKVTHIKPVPKGGLHETANDLLLCSDIHRLFDRGYVTVTPGHRFRVSRELKEDFHNGEESLQLAGSELWIPRAAEDQPNREFVERHTDAVFRWWVPRDLRVACDSTGRRRRSMNGEGVKPGSNEMSVQNPLPPEVYRRRTRPRDYGVRGDYFRDQTAIIHSMPFRRLKHKTQVFFAPENDHVCTRMEHVLHVGTIAGTICRGLRTHGWAVDPDLAMAIGLGHDLGHAPFGHAGETALSAMLGARGAFLHEVNGYRVAELLANYGQGLNLTYAVKDGMICHNGEEFERSLAPASREKDLAAIRDRSHLPSTIEGCAVRFADKIAYLGRDIEDAITAKLIHLEDVPESIRQELGGKNGEIIDTLVEDVIDTSASTGTISLSEARHSLMVQLRDFNYSSVYGHPRIQRYVRESKRVIQALFEHLAELHTRLGAEYRRYAESGLPLDKYFARYLQALEDFYVGETQATIVTDYIAGMTDDFALEAMRQISIPKAIEFRPPEVAAP